MSISAAQVKELRDLTGAGMMDCKAALAETNGDMEAAVDWLRAKGIAKADKKAGRVAAEGLIGVEAGVREAAIVEVNSETDFVARNDAFQAIVANVAKVALAYGSTEAVANAKYPGSDKTVTETIDKLSPDENGVLFIGESGKIFVSRGTLLASDPKILSAQLAADAVRFPLRSERVDFIEAVRTRRPTMEDAEVGQRTISICHLAHIGVKRNGAVLAWDPVSERFPRDAEANKHLTGPSGRAPWVTE